MKNLSLKKEQEAFFFCFQNIRLKFSKLLLHEIRIASSPFP